MTLLRRFSFMLAAMTGLAAHAAGTPCTPEALKRLPSQEDLAKLCPKQPLFAKAPQTVSDPRGGCSLMFVAEGGGMLQVTAAKQLMEVAGGPKANAEKAAQQFGKMSGGKGPAVKRMPWKSVEAYALENTPGYFVDSGGQVLVVHVTAVMAKPPSDDCVEAIVLDVAKRFAAR